MLDLIAQTLGNLDQAGLLIGGAACFVLGAYFVGTALRWRIRGTEVRGRVIGVRAKKNVYYPVYRYLGEDGIEHEAMSSSGSNGTQGKETGRELTLLTLAGHPNEAHESSSYAFDVVGWVLLLVGGGLLYLAFRLRPVSLGTWLMLGLLALYLAVKMQRVWKPRGSPSTLERWADVPIVPIEDLLARPASEQQRKLNRVWGPALLAIGFALFALGAHLSFKTRALEANGVRVGGSVVRLEESSGDADSGSTYFPVVSFIPRGDAEAREFRDHAGSNPPAYRVGESVTVLYLPGDPAGTATIDRQGWNWLAPVGVLVIGAFFSWAGVGLTRQSWRST